MGIPLLRGESFRPTAARMPSVKRDMPSMVAYLRSIKLEAVINETMARRYWPGEDPIGKTFRFGPPSLEGPQVKIIGLVSDSRQYGLDRAIEPQFYFSSDQFPLFDTRLVVRTAGDVPDLAAAIRKAVAECQPDAVVVSVDTMDRVVGRTLASRRLSVTVLTSFAGVALLLAALGLYATMSYLVAQRTQEIGVRMALGAARGDVHRMVVREGAVIAGAGVAVGLAAALAGSRVVAGMLYGVTATDAVTYVGSAVLLGLISLLATYLPARRASSVDPMAALRLE
jgi:putative ABC transport system permease protein